MLPLEESEKYYTATWKNLECVAVNLYVVVIKRMKLYG